MAADTKGLLVFIRGITFFSRFLNFVVASLVYVFVSEKVATATGAIVSWLGKTGSKSTAGRQPAGQAYAAVSTSEPSGSAAEEGLEKMQVLEPALPPSRTQKWLNAFTSSLKGRMLSIIILLWIMNLLYPSESPPDGHLVCCLFFHMALCLGLTNNVTPAPNALKTETFQTRSAFRSLHIEVVRRKHCKI